MKYVVRLIVASLFLAFGSFSTFAKEPPPNYSRSQVVDEATVLLPSEREDLKKSLRSIERATGAQVAVLTVKSLEGDDLKKFSLSVARKWALGQRGKNNGLLITFIQESGALRIEVGRGLEGALPDSRVGQMIIQFQTRLKEGMGYGPNFSQLVSELSAIIHKEAGVEKSTSAEKAEEKTRMEKHHIFYILSAIVAAIIGAVTWTKSFRYIPGGVVGSASWALIAYTVAPETVLLFGILGFVVAIVLSFLFRHGGDTIGFWPGGGPGGGSIGGMGSGGGDFAGAGADVIGDIIGGIFS